MVVVVIYQVIHLVYVVVILEVVELILVKMGQLQMEQQLIVMLVIVII